MPWMSAPIFTSMRARSCTWGSQAALPITVVPGRQRGGHQRVLGRHHRRLVHEDVASARRPRGRAEHDLAAALDVGAHRAEGVEVRVEAAAADHVAAGRRHHGAAEAREQRARRAGTRRGSARRARGRPRRRATLGGAQRDLVGRRASSTAHAESRAGSRASPRRRGCAARCARRPRPR